MTRADVELLKHIYDQLTDGEEIIANFDYMKQFKSIIDSEFKLLDLHLVSKRSEQLIALIGTDTDIVLGSGIRGRLLEHREESFLVEYNHNGHADWEKASEIELTKSN